MQQDISVDVWICGSADVWMCGSLDVWLCGCMDVWICGSVDVLFCGCSAKNRSFRFSAITPLFYEITVK